MAKNLYKVEITETLQRTVEVLSDSPSDAICNVEKDYYAERYVLDSEDYIMTEFKLFDDSDN